MAEEDETPTPTTLRQVMWDGQKHFSRSLPCDSDGSLLCTEESFEGSDEKLLAMLGDMARGDPEQDAPSRVLLDECGALWEEVTHVKTGKGSPSETWGNTVHTEAEAQREMQLRLRRELRHLQERSHRQHQESAAFMQRLSSAREALAEKIREARSENEELRRQLRHVKERVGCNSCSLSESIRELNAHAAELQAEIWEVSDCQVNLVDQLHEASETQARLQAELQRERVKTWRQSTDVVMAFAGGKDMKEIEREESERQLLEAQLAEVAERAAACGVPPLLEQDPETAEATLAMYGDVEVPFSTVQRYLEEMEELRAELQTLEQGVGSNDGEAEERLNSEQEELSALQAELIDAEARAESSKQDLEEATSLFSTLRVEVNSEQDVLRQAEQAATSRRDLFRSQVEEKRRELLKMQETTDTLIDDLNTKGCFWSLRQEVPKEVHAEGRHHPTRLRFTP
ncbi:unnamed protein product [Cladocopium goreaui]|uniref:Uncharacterized protein n=1 Tax=Cladocopium goreaui TaxID=2562237 RepID=A0A9P1M605_9DINO|nr:unnamed protein product [Cladocopium goreaui]